MRRSLSAASAVALVATLLTAMPAAADDLGRVQQPVLRAPADVDGAEAVVAPVSEDAHPVETEVELVSFGTEPAEGTPEAVGVEESQTADSEVPESEFTEPGTTPTDEAVESETPADSSETPTDEAVGSDEVEGTGTADEAQGQIATAATNGAMTSLAVTDEASTEVPTMDEPADPSSDETPTAEAPADQVTTEDPTEDPTDESTQAPTDEPTDQDPEDVATEGDHDGHDHAEGEHDHGEEGHDHDASGEELSTQLYASAETAELAVLGVTWDLGSAPADLVVEMRTQAEDVWGEWEPLHVEATETRDDEAELADARDGTLPTALIGADAVEVRLASDTTLPASPSLALVDPGESTADAAPVTTAAMTTTATSRPTIYSRAQWGADESKMTWNPSQGRVQGIDIHHTVNANDYTAEQVPALMRSIYAYHAEDWGRGWGDIGYNFVVDRFGRIWEGRYGGVDQAPVGAHATGLNSNFSGISLLGNFDTVAVPAAAFTSVARLAAWKLAMHGNTTASGTVTVDAGTFSRVNGHRDSKQTTCPGRYMYNRLGEMRTRINSYIGSFADRQLDRDLDGDGHADLVVTNGSTVSLMSTVDRGSWSTRVLGNSGWTDRTVAPGDFNGDGRNDTILVDSGGRMWLYPGLSSGLISAKQRVRIGTGWASFTSIFGGADWDGDGNVDLIARHKDGTLRLYRGNGRGGFLDARTIGRGWNSFTSLSLAPSFVAGRPAVLGERAGSAELWVYPGDGRGGFNSAIIATRQWASQRQATGVGDATGDGRGDVVAIDTAGVLWLYPGTSTGGVDVSGRILIGTGWRGLLIRSHWAAGGEDLALLGISTTGRMTRYAWTQGQAAFTGLRDTGVRVTSGSRVIPAGDWNGDGRADLVVATSAGALLLHAGLGNGRFAASGTRIGTGWAGMTSIVGAGNWRGDGLPGLIAYERSAGRLWFYPGNGSGGFGTRVLVSNGAAGMNYLVNAGRWDLGGAPDLLMRGADTARLFFYNGNGPGLAMPPVLAGQGWGGMDSLIGINDVTRDGRPDLVAVTGTGTIMVYPGNGVGGFGSASIVGSVRSTAVVS